MKARLNLATKPLQTHRRFLAGSTALGVVGAIVFLGLGWNVYQARKANQEMRAKTAQIQQKVEQLEAQRTALERFFAQDQNAKLHDRAAFINSLIDARSFDWTKMFMDLENILPSGVRVVSIEPAQEKGRVEVKFTVGATNDEAKLKFLKALEDSNSFTDIQVIAVRQGNQGKAGGDPILVELTAAYVRT
jgi:type IV pilus assembly protein PilN